MSIQFSRVRCTPEGTLNAQPKPGIWGLEFDEKKQWEMDVGV